MVAGGVHEKDSEANGQVEVGVVVPERLCPNGHVLEATDVVGKCRLTNRHVISAGSIVAKRIETHRGIVGPAGEVEQSVITLSGVAARIAAIRGRTPKAFGVDKTPKQASASAANAGQVNFVIIFMCRFLSTTLKGASYSCSS